MNNIKEQVLGSLRIERFAGLSAAAAGMNWNTYKSLDLTVKTPVDSVNVMRTAGQA